MFRENMFRENMFRENMHPPRTNARSMKSNTHASMIRRAEAVGRLASQRVLVGGTVGGDKSELGRSAGAVHCDWQ